MNRLDSHAVIKIFPFKQGGVSLQILYHKYAMVYLGNLSESIIHLSQLLNCMEFQFFEFTQHW